MGGDLLMGPTVGGFLMLTEVNRGRMTLNEYVGWASENPARVWGLYPNKGSLDPGADGDLTVVDT